MGTYPVKAKAKDSNGAESNWSEVYQVTIGAALPSFSVQISAKKGVTASLRNNGTAEATDVAWSVNVTGGILHRIAVLKTDTVASLAPEASASLQTSVFFGLGGITIDVVASCDEGVSAHATKTGTIFFFLVKVK